MLTLDGISPSLEDYLEVILDLTEQNLRVRVTDLADKLQVAKSSVNQAVKRLDQLDLIRHEKYGPLELTPKGAEIALKISQRHECLKRFFIEILGNDRSTAENDACHIEHHMSPITMERLVAFRN